MEYIQYEEFKKLDIRVGTVLSAEPVEGADKLLKCMVDVGEEEPRQIVSGIREFVGDGDEIVGRQLLYVLNLEPRTIRGVESRGMLLAVDAPDDTPAFLIPEKKVLGGAKMR
ncbi:MAG: methionine--tRNA ligase beta chain [Flavobacteriaceae bacterium]|jgi:methionine--tRNA ligase beta chain